MCLAQDNDVVHTFTPDRSDQPSDKAILPRRGWCGRLVPDAHGAQSERDDGAINAIPIADEVVRSLIPGKCFRYLTCNPFGRGICCDVDPDEVSAAEPDEKPIVGTTNRSMAAMSGAWLRRKVRHPWLGGPRRLTMYLATLDCATSNPSLSSSPSKADFRRSSGGSIRAAPCRSAVAVPLDATPNASSRESRPDANEGASRAG
jgi:hypothetical protein